MALEGPGRVDVQGVFTGFVTIGAVIAVGFLLAHVKMLDARAQRVLVKLAFFVASPALMVTVLSRTDVSRLFSANLIASVSSVAVVSVVCVVLARLLWRRTVGETVIGTFASAYVNAGNLGLPIAAYVLGDAALVAPMLLTQLLVFQPLGLLVLDLTTTQTSDAASRRARVISLLTLIARNPLTIGSLIGLLLATFSIPLPPPIAEPLELIAGMAVPAMLLAYGVSLRLGPLPGAGEPASQIVTIVALKLILQPLCAFLVARYALGLSPPEVFAVAVIAALPTAQNVFTLAVRYRTGEILARDTIFCSTILSVPVIVILTALLG
jgi:malonate transporter and related proteins